MNPVLVKNMSKKNKFKTAGPFLEKKTAIPFEGDTLQKERYPPLVFSNIVEFCIVFFCVTYSLFCLDAYFLNAVNLKLSVLNLSFLLVPELLLLGVVTFKKIQMVPEIRTALYGILVFLISFIISLKISPSLLSTSWSADYPHHYILIDFLSVHEQLPLLTSGLGEMVQYPFGPSLFTSVIAKILPVSLMTATGAIAAVMSALIVVTVYLLAREFLKKLSPEKFLADAGGLISAFMVFSVPVYFLDQYTGNFYYSMMFGELLVLICLLALMKIETGDRTWIFILILATMGIIFSYTLYIIIPVCAFLFFAILNPDKCRVLVDWVTILSGVLVASLFLLFSYERMQIGTHILQYEGLTVELKLMNFNILFTVLVIAGIIIGLKIIPAYLRSSLFVYSFIIIAEYFAFIFLNQFGLIALYYANKIFYLLIMVLSVSACIPVVFAVKYIRKDHIRTIAAFSIIGLIGIYSVFGALNFPVRTIPVVTNEDVIFSHKAEAYLKENAIPYDNMSITTAELKGYWLGLLLHMDKNYAQKRFLGEPTAFEDWLKNPDARYVAGEMMNNSYPEYFDMDGVRLQIVVREGQKVLIKKVE